MPWHPAIGDYRQQLPRIAVIAAMFAAAATLIALHQQRASMPSERWYRLSRQQVMEADLSWRLGAAIEQLGGRVGITEAETVRQMRQRAIAGWERRALAERPSHAAAMRLGIIYGRQGYTDQSGDMFTLAASLHEDQSDFYHALSEIYATGEPSEETLRQKAELIASRDENWLTDIALQDVYERVQADEQLAQIQQRRYGRTMRFAAGLLVVGLITGLLLGLGIVTLGVLGYRRGFRVNRSKAKLPFMVPWTLIDVAEAVAVLLFTMVVGGMLTNLALGRVLRPDEWSLGRPILVSIQYILVSAITIGVIWYRVRSGGASRPLSILGLRARRALTHIGTGLSGYAAFVTLLIIIATIIAWLLGGSMPMAQTTEEMIGSAQTPAEVAIYFVLVCILAPVFEELIFRGYVYAGLRRIMSARAAILLGAAAFAAVHLNGEAFLVIGLIGAMLCYLYERSRSLLPGMIAHGVHNGLVLAIMLLQSA